MRHRFGDRPASAHSRILPLRTGDHTLNCLHTASPSASMYRLRMLGGFAVENAAGVSVGPLPQRRAEAALAVLAVAGQLGCTRHRLIALLWPESDETHGRHNLRDVLHAIRHTLGGDAIDGAGTMLRLTGGVDSDVGEFQRALATSRLHEAAALYQGPLLDGFHLDRAAEFERWLDLWRAHFARACLDAVERLADVAERTGRWHDAASWWARAEEIDPFSTSVVMHHMRALEHDGDMANALRDGEAHQRRLMEELDVEPDVAFIDGLARLRGGAVASVPAMPPFVRPRVPRQAEPSLDRAFQVLANPTQRAVVERLRGGPAAVGELARLMNLPLPAMRRHLQEMQSSAVVVSRKVGGTRSYRLNREVLRTAERWLAAAISDAGPPGANG